ncbi:MAG: hypothetical protein ACI9SY_000089 [Candidatus Paceibacteria bacterium]|jgi:hypothetical protein
MINRNHIEKILKINGMSPAEPDEMIRSVLLSARYDKDEVDTALVILREDSETKQIRVEGLHKVFRSNDSLQPKEISELLGIDVDLNHYMPESAAKQRVTLASVMFVWILSVGLAVIGIFLFMHMNSVGIFHPSVYL